MDFGLSPLKPLITHYPAYANDDDAVKGVPAKRNEKRYDCCPEVYIDITFTVRIQRRKLYYIFNLVVPCLMMSCLWTS